ncbi:MAG: DUF6612 family protein [Natrialbaceae archaeon]|nr:DUF6612 family protein [Natrialbaceae archaeon]
MDRSPRTIAVVSLVAVLLAAGCLGGLTGEDRTAEEIQNDALAAMESVESYSFDLTMTMSIDSESSSGFMAGPFEIDVEGAVDILRERMQMTMSMPMIGSVDTYIVNDTMYTMSPVSGEWTTEPAPGDVFETATMDLEDQRKVLENANVTHEGTEELGDRTVNVLRLNASGQTVAELLSEDLEGGELPQSSFGNATFEQFDIVFYLGQDDNLLYRMTLDANISSTMGSMDLGMEMTFDDYNQEFDIQPPDEARD